MNENKTAFNFILQIFGTYGIIVVIFVVLSLVLPEEVCEVSSLFALGKTGITNATLLQLLLLAVLISVSRIVFLTDRVFSKMAIILRNILFFLTVLVMIILFVVLFKWFPIADVKAWIGFFVSYIICTSIGVFISRWAEKQENIKMEAALKKYRE
jgi:hypothetical protein